MLHIEMSASTRTVSGKGPMRQLRMKGQTPAVVYGFGAEALKLQMETKSLMANLLKYYRKNTLVTLSVDESTKKSVLIGEVQTDPVKDTLIHVDFCEIDLEKSRAFDVPVNYQGTPVGVDLGGVLNTIHNTLVLEGKPLDMPDEIVVDVAALNIGDNIKCDAIQIPDSVQLVTSKDTVAVSVDRPGVKVEETEEEEEEVVVETPAAEAAE